MATTAVQYNRTVKDATEADYANIPDGTSQTDHDILVAGRVRARKQAARKTARAADTTPKENATFTFLDECANSFLRAADTFGADVPEAVENYLYDMADLFAAITKTDSTYMSGTLRTRGGDVAVMPKVRRNNRANRDGQNNGAATPATV
jgi:hypothetical protein